VRGDSRQRPRRGRRSWSGVVLVGGLLLSLPAAGQPVGGPAGDEPRAPRPAATADDAGSRGSPAATAGEGRGFDELVRTGLQHYQAGRYRQALGDFQAAQRQRPEPNLLYNIARCHHQLGEVAPALAGYRQFLESSAASPAERDRTARYLQELERAPAALAPAGQPAAPAAIAAPPAPSSSPPVPSPPRDGPAAQAAPGLAAVFGGTLLGIGAAGLVTGGLFGVLALQEKTAFDEAPDYASKRDHQERLERDALAADICFASGAALLVTGGLLLLWGGDEDEPAAADRRAQLILGPTVLPTGGGLLLGGRF
jgi:tetratricopeptide (TPR) repeat protein